MTITADEIVDRVVSVLRGMDATLSGDDSPLASVWDEIKEQVQNEQSIYWDVYWEIMKDLVAGTIEEAKESGEVEPPPYCDSDDQQEIEDAFLEILLSRAEEEPVECVPFDFQYFCYPILDFTVYGIVLKRTGLGTCQAKVFSVAAPSGEIGTVQVSKIDCLLSEDDFLSAQKKGWPEKWGCT
jgi:hypothetical protein